MKIQPRLSLLGGTDYTEIEDKTAAFLKVWDALPPQQQQSLVAQNVVAGEIYGFGEHTTEELNEIGMHLAETGRINKMLMRFFDPLNGEILGDRISSPKINRRQDVAALLDAHTSQNQSRRNLTGVFYDVKNQCLVATDGYSMVMIPQQVSGENRIILMRHVGASPKGSLVDGNFPNWQAVIPENCVEQSWDWRLAHSKLRVAVRINQAGNKMMPPAAFVVWLAEGGCVRFNPSYVLCALDTLIAAGAHRVRLLMKGVNLPMLLEGDTGSKAVIMPIRSDGAVFWCLCPANIGTPVVL